MTTFTKNAIQILKNRYPLKGKEGITIYRYGRKSRQVFQKCNFNSGINC